MEPPPTKSAAALNTLRTDLKGQGWENITLTASSLSATYNNHTYHVKDLSTLLEPGQDVDAVAARIIDLFAVIKASLDYNAQRPITHLDYKAQTKSTLVTYESKNHGTKKLEIKDLQSHKAQLAEKEGRASDKNVKSKAFSENLGKILTHIDTIKATPAAPPTKQTGSNTNPQHRVDSENDEALLQPSTSSKNAFMDTDEYTAQALPFIEHTGRLLPKVTECGQKIMAARSNWLETQTDKEKIEHSDLYGITTHLASNLTSEWNECVNQERKPFNEGLLSDEAQQSHYAMLDKHISSMEESAKAFDETAMQHTYNFVTQIKDIFISQSTLLGDKSFYDSFSESIHLKSPSEVCIDFSKLNLKKKDAEILSQALKDIGAEVSDDNIGTATVNLKTGAITTAAAALPARPEKAAVAPAKATIIKTPDQLTRKINDDMRRTIREMTAKVDEFKKCLTTDELNGNIGNNNLSDMLDEKITNYRHGITTEIERINEKSFNTFVVQSHLQKNSVIEKLSEELLILEQDVSQIRSEAIRQAFPDVLFTFKPPNPSRHDLECAFDLNLSEGTKLRTYLNEQGCKFEATRAKSFSSHLNFKFSKLFTEPNNYENLVTALNDYNPRVAVAPAKAGKVAPAKAEKVEKLAATDTEKAQKRSDALTLLNEIETAKLDGLEKLDALRSKMTDEEKNKFKISYDKATKPYIDERVRLKKLLDSPDTLDIGACRTQLRAAKAKAEYLISELESRTNLNEIRSKKIKKLMEGKITQKLTNTAHLFSFDLSGEIKMLGDTYPFVATAEQKGKVTHFDLKVPAKKGIENKETYDSLLNILTVLKAKSKWHDELQKRKEDEMKKITDMQTKAKASLRPNYYKELDGIAEKQRKDLKELFKSHENYVSGHGVNKKEAVEELENELKRDIPKIDLLEINIKNLKKKEIDQSKIATVIIKKFGFGELKVKDPPNGDRKIKFECEDEQQKKEVENYFNTFLSKPITFATEKRGDNSEFFSFTINDSNYKNLFKHLQKNGEVSDD
jgi:hypothetical protein